MPKRSCSIKVSILQCNSPFSLTAWTHKCQGNSSSKAFPSFKKKKKSRAESSCFLLPLDYENVAVAVVMATRDSLNYLLAWMLQACWIILFPASIIVILKQKKLCEHMHRLIVGHYHSKYLFTKVRQKLYFCAGCGANMRPWWWVCVIKHPCMCTACSLITTSQLLTLYAK